MNRDRIVVGYDIGGTKIGVGLADSNGKLLGKARIENKDTRPEEILPLMAETARKLAAEANLPFGAISMFGVSAPGPADIPNGILTAPPNNKHWRNVPVKQYLIDALKLPGVFENDANCGALAEWYFGAGRNCDDFIYLTMSTGIGGGIVAGGHLIRGRGYYAGEVGHTVIELNGRQCNCGLKGCYEAYAGGRAIAQHVQALLKDRPDHPIVAFAGGKLDDVDMSAIEKAVRAGDPLALEIWDEMSLRNAQGMGILINTFNPAKLILGTLAWAVGALYLDPIRKYLPQFAWPQTLAQCELVPSELRRDIGYYAGCAAALYELKERGEL
ncbi:MAG: ROK family protein [Victivallaceae bacterium]|nr:ROK family protein [Victivallaceae bacterium]